MMLLIQNNVLPNNRNHRYDLLLCMCREIVLSSVGMKNAEFGPQL